MCLGLWTDIPECQDVIGFINDIRRDVTGDHLAENTIRHALPRVDCLKNTPAIKGVRERCPVHILKLTPKRHPVGQATGRHMTLTGKLLNIVCGGLPFDSGVGS